MSLFFRPPLIFLLIYLIIACPALSICSCHVTAWMSKLNCSLLSFVWKGERMERQNRLLPIQYRDIRPEFKGRADRLPSSGSTWVSCWWRVYYLFRSNHYPYDVNEWHANDFQRMNSSWLSKECPCSLFHLPPPPPPPPPLLISFLRRYSFQMMSLWL